MENINEIVSEKELSELPMWLLEFFWKFSSLTCAVSIFIGNFSSKIAGKHLDNMKKITKAIEIKKSNK